MTYIEGGLFEGCDGLTSVIIPNSVTSIGNCAFSGCGLTSIEIPNSVTSIGNMAFFYCYALSSVTIPKSVTSIDYQAFSGCNNLISIKVEEGNPIYDSRDNCNAIIKTADNELISGCNKTIIPNSVTSIGKNAFEYHGVMTSVIIPDGVTSIGSMAFYACSGLTSVALPNSVTSIGEYAFSYCIRLKDFYCYAKNLPNTQNRIFEHTLIDSGTLHVPESSIEAYKEAVPWKNFKEIVAIKDFIPGDANGDGNVDTVDIVDIINHMTGKPTSTGVFEEDAADTNEDGVINAADVVKLVNIIMDQE